MAYTVSQPGLDHHWNVMILSTYVKFPLTSCVSYSPCSTISDLPLALRNIRSLTLHITSTVGLWFVTSFCLVDGCQRVGSILSVKWLNFKTICSSLKSIFVFKTARNQTNTNIVDIFRENLKYQVVNYGYRFQFHYF
jgi:hypothetical protein